MHQDNPLITIQQEGPQITAWISSSSPAVSEGPKQDHGYGYLTGPLRQRGLEVTVEYGLSDYIVDVALPDGSSVIISPPQEPPSENPEFPENWTAIRHRSAGPALYEVIYDSEPDGPDAQHGSNVSSLLAAVDARLDQLGVPPRPGQHRSSRDRAADEALRRAGFISAISFDGERYHRLPAAMTEPAEQRRAVTRAFTALQADGFNVLCDSALLRPGTPPARPHEARLGGVLTTQPDPVQNPVAPTALPTSVPPRVSAALAPSPSAGSRTVRTRLAAEALQRAALPPARPSTAPGR
ncbi:hypothetical protein ACIO8G_04165 [Streptomyces sp. NPDC087219]|uniref:hypothetical protein n=1 Tax=unclassified Streptomyces TaxID=2593676 RepID=UPI0022501330|nr:hypothetical protein [Streptomyces sp. NBC_00233]MCX5230474.1 hypothetical protein [Streptomyces sp. NBC_00233]